MPNPDFTGDVPSRRCETCEYWSQWPSLRWGACTASAATVQGTVVTATMVTTTDLTVCSNWDRKKE